ncbi:MAG: hypothetical protein BEN19_02050 [Epulopiscium sp. Nuni2H_MBin003]|nr:MAG: hypothetical protein BEN19_02050 [Epulopiscium sp. Nuni2H_MBin003]
MDNLGNIKHVFASSNTHLGIYQIFNFGCLKNTKFYILKGGPGTGKTVFLKKLGTELVDSGQNVTYYHNTINPDFLDAVYVPNLNVMFISYNLVINKDIPTTLFATIIDLDEFLDEHKILPHKDAIINSYNIVDRCLTHARFYLESANAIYRNYLFTTEPCIKQDAKLKYENALFKTLSGIVSDVNKIGTAQYFYGYAVTGDGLVDNLHTIIGKSKNIYLVKETLVCSSKQLMKRICDLFIYRGYDIECYVSPFDNEKIEDIIVKDLSLAITISNLVRKPKVFPTDIYDFIHCVDDETFDIISLPVEKDFKLFNSLLDKAYLYISNANKNLENIRIYYNAAMDLSNIDQIYETTLKEILGYD